MACVALTSLIKTIEIELLGQPTQTARVSLSLHRRLLLIISLVENLSSLQAFLQKNSSGEGNGDGDGDGGALKLRDLEIKIRDFALKAEDDIELQLSNFILLKAELEDYSRSCCHELLHQTLQKAAELWNIIETQTSKTYWLKHVANVVESSDDESDGFLKPEGRMIGRHNDCRVIKDKLFTPSSVIPSIISIVGMVGIGKTTVARYVYEDPSVASHFDVRGWVTIPPHQHYNKSRMLSQLLHSITQVEEPNVIKKGSTPHELEMQVRKCFGGKKYLIVLDNIMSKQTWMRAWTDIIGCAFNGLAGSYVLLTTRHFNLDVQWRRYTHIHNMTLLDPKESWELFCNILSIDEEHLAPKFQTIRNHVVEKCDGLPQLIVEVAKRLSKCNNIQQGWKKIEKE